MKATFDLDDGLYRAIKVEAARLDRSVRDIVHEALTGWLERSEDDEDRASAQSALDEYRRDGGQAAESWFAEMAAETRATYAADEAQAPVEMPAPDEA
jgi:plasmid stability protein